MRNFFKRRKKARKIKRSKNDRQWVKDLKVPIKTSTPKEISEIKRERKRNSRKQRFSFLGKIFNKRILFRFTLFFLVIGLFGLLYFFAQENRLFFVRNINITGLQQIQEDLVRSRLEDFEGKSLYEFSVNEVSDQVLATNDLIEKAYVRKVLPDTLEIEVIERVPMLFASNFNQTFLIDTNLEVIEIIETETVKLNDYELEVFNGFGDKDADYVKERFFLNLDEAEAEELQNIFDTNDNDEEGETEEDPWNKVDEEEKEKILKDIFDETNAILGAWKESVRQEISATEFSELPVFYFYSERSFNENIDFYQQRTSFALNFANYLNEKEIGIRDQVWLTDFTYKVDVIDNKRFLLSIRRDLEEQVSDIEAILWNNQYSNGSVFDLRTEKNTKR
jgi:hypothetical protein